MSEGLVAPSWSDSGEVPVGEVTELRLDWTRPLWLVWSDQPVSLSIAANKAENPNAKPSLPSLSRVSGEAYRGLGWCDEGA